MKRKSITLTNDMQGITEGMDFIQEELKKLKVKAKQINDAMLLVEESIVSLQQNTAKDKQIVLTLIKKFGGISVRLVAPGAEYMFMDSVSMGTNWEEDEIEQSTETAIRNLLLKSFGDKLQYKNRNKQNTVQIVVKKAERKLLYLTLMSLCAAIILGVVFKKILPGNVTSAMSKYAFVPFKTMFLNALKMIVAPVVFFSIVSCIAQFSNISEFGKIGTRIVSSYMFTTFIAIGIGLLMFLIFTPGSEGLLVVKDTTTAVTTTNAVSMSILDTVVKIVPSNIIQPFVDADMLQIIFIAVLCGIAVGMIGDYSKPLKNFFEGFNTLFLKITSLIVMLMPIAIFCSVMDLLLKMGADSLMSLLGFFGCIILGMVCMMIIYCLILFAVGRLNPFIFLKKFAPGMLTTFSLSSSNASMPYTMQLCKNNLGISPKVYSFSIPLGSTINMDGSCVYFMIAGLFLARNYGVAITSSMLFTLIFAVFILSVGAPGIPGAALVCMSVILVQIGVPVEATVLIMGIDPIISMFRAMSNVVGDVVISTVVAKKSHLLNEKIYYQKN